MTAGKIYTVVALAVAIAVVGLSSTAAFATVCHVKADQTNTTAINFKNTCEVTRVNEWHFVITNVSAASQCPGSLDTVFAGTDGTCNTGDDVHYTANKSTTPPNGFSGGVCHYSLVGHQTEKFCDATYATACKASPSQFNLSSAPCVITGTDVVSNVDGSQTCSPQTNGTGAGCVDIATETTCNTVDNDNLPAKFWDIATTNAPAGNVKFKTYEQAVNDLTCTTAETICSAGNLVTTDASGITGVAGQNRTVISKYWFADQVNTDTARAFQACIVNSAGTELLCSGCEGFPIDVGEGGPPSGSCPTRTRGFYGNHVPCGDIPLPTGFGGTYGQDQLNFVCGQLGLGLSGSACTAELCSDLDTNGGGCGQLGAQLVTALLNQQVFVGSTIPAECNVTDAIAAFTAGADDTGQCTQYINCLDTFNNSGDNLNQCVQQPS